jgi:hypothetical protein
MNLFSRYSDKATGWTTEVPFLTGERYFSLLHSVQTDFRAYPASCSLGVKLPAPEADHAPPSDVDVKNGGAIHPLSYTSSWHNYPVPCYDSLTELHTPKVSVITVYIEVSQSSLAIAW